MKSATFCAAATSGEFSNPMQKDLSVVFFLTAIFCAILAMMDESNPPLSSSP